jgi:hypothetical protein
MPSNKQYEWHLRDYARGADTAHSLAINGPPSGSVKYAIRPSSRELYTLRR